MLVRKACCGRARSARSLTPDIYAPGSPYRFRPLNLIEGYKVKLDVIISPRCLPLAYKRLPRRQSDRKLPLG